MQAAGATAPAIAGAAYVVDAVIDCDPTPNAQVPIPSTWTNLGTDGPVHLVFWGMALITSCCGEWP